jgi:hypothetical protein
MRASKACLQTSTVMPWKEVYPHDLRHKKVRPNLVHMYSTLASQSIQCAPRTSCSPIPMAFPPKRGKVGWMYLDSFSRSQPFLERRVLVVP